MKWGKTHVFHVNMINCILIKSKTLKILDIFYFNLNNDMDKIWICPKYDFVYFVYRQLQNIIYVYDHQESVPIVDTLFIVCDITEFILTVWPVRRVPLVIIPTHLRSPLWCWCSCWSVFYFLLVFCECVCLFVVFPSLVMSLPVYLLIMCFKMSLCDLPIIFYISYSKILNIPNNLFILQIPKPLLRYSEDVWTSI